MGTNACILDQRVTSVIAVVVCGSVISEDIAIYCIFCKKEQIPMEWKGLEADMTHEHRQQNGFSIVQQSGENTLSLINLPDVVLEAILSNLTYDEISKNRIVRSAFSFN